MTEGGEGNKARNKATRNKVETILGASRWEFCEWQKNITARIEGKHDDEKGFKEAFLLEKLEDLDINIENMCRNWDFKKHVFFIFFKFYEQNRIRQLE